MYQSPNSIIKKIIKDIKFIDFINEIKIDALIVIKMIKFLSISGDLNDDTFNECITNNMFLLENNVFEKYITFCKLFRTKYKESDLCALVSGHNITYSHK